jgi:hypothetical protein
MDSLTQVSTPSGVTTRRAAVHISAERRWVVIFALLVMLATTLPYLIGYFRQGADWRFSGFLFAVEDGNSYIAKMLSGSVGAWSFRTPFTPLPQSGVLEYLPYLLLGKLAAGPGLHDQLVALFQALRLASGFLMILATYDFLALFIRSERLRRFGLVIAVLGGGLGWLLFLTGRDSWLGSLPLEFYSPETFGFLSLYGIPHLAAARALFLWTLVAYLKAGEIENPRFPWNSAVIVGLLWLAVGFFQPLSMIVLGAVIGAYLALLAFWLWRRPLAGGWQRWKRMTGLAVTAGLFTLPLLAYNLFALLKDPFFQAWSRQNYLPSPNPLHYLLAYGLILPIALLGIRGFYRREPWKALFLIAWLGLLPLLAYSPTNIQRRLVEGGWLVLVALGMVCLEQSERLTARQQSLIRILLWFVFPSTLILLAGGILSTARPAAPIFRPTAEIAMFQELGRQSRQGELVMAAYETGNALPAWVPLKVMVGHGPESINLEQLRSVVARFYQVDTPDAERIKMIDEYGIDYVVWGPYERGLGKWNPELAGFLEPLQSNGDYKIYRVARRSAWGFMPGVTPNAGGGW